MAGQGFYNENSSTQAKAMTPAFPYLEAAAGAIPLNGPRVEIADYGASQGKNALEPMQLALNIIRQRQSTIPIRITHTDQPANDFATLFGLLQNSPQSYLKLFPETYAAAAGKSFYTQIFPPASIDLMWSSIAVHWMSRIPVPLTDHIWSSFARGRPARWSLSFR